MATPVVPHIASACGGPVGRPPRWTRRGWLYAACGSALAAAGLSPARADLPALVAASRASVLPVGTFNPVASPRFGFRGSGFVVGDGTLLVTNAHVLPEPGTVPEPQLAVLSVARADAPGRDATSGQETTGGAPVQVRRATVVKLDRARDLALLRLEGPPLPALSLAEPASVREGMEIALMGFPIGGIFGFSMVTHRGIVASITSIALPSPTATQLDARAVAQLRDGPFEVYQLDATAYPGNSGGPVLDPRSGRVVGVVNMVLVRGTRESALSQPTGISYAIPVRFVQDLLAR
jgi:S1-C subfamily serine protease